jgi:hypothetical protein
VKPIKSFLRTAVALWVMFGLFRNFDDAVIRQPSL